MNDTDLATLSRTDDSNADRLPGGRQPRHLPPPLVNRPGELVWIGKHELHVDRNYQRMLNRRRVNRIANAWNWVACGCLSVSMRKDGSGHFVFDGQHRWQAALLLKDVKELPCVVYELDSAAEEAAGFVATNTERRLLRRLEQHSALLIIRDPIALKIDQLAREAGRTIGIPSGPTKISAVTALMRVLQDDQQVLFRAWPVIVAVCEGHAMPGRLIDAIWATERRMLFGQSLTDARWRDRLVKLGADELLRALRTAYVFEGRINQQIMAEAIKRQINRGLKSGKLNLKAEAFVRGSDTRRES